MYNIYIKKKTLKLLYKINTIFFFLGGDQYIRRTIEKWKGAMKFALYLISEYKEENLFFIPSVQVADCWYYLSSHCVSVFRAFICFQQVALLCVWLFVLRSEKWEWVQHRCLEKQSKFYLHFWKRHVK